MRTTVIKIAACAIITWLTVDSALSYPRNLLSPKLGASITTKSELRGSADPNALLSDGPISRGRLRFADIPQNRSFTADLGARREFDTIEIGTGGQPGNIEISVAVENRTGPYKTVCKVDAPGYFQTLRFQLVKARYVRFDFAKAPHGCIVHNLRLYRGYKRPRLIEVTKLLHERIKPRLPGLEGFYKAAEAQDWPRACKELRAYFACLKKPEGPPAENYDLTRANSIFEGKLDFARLQRT
ncbi:MAG: hypothetical protein ACYS8Z_20040, partial [Planctomycetota bacterium]